MQIWRTLVVAVAGGLPQRHDNVLSGCDIVSCSGPEAKPQLRKWALAALAFAARLPVPQALGYRQKQKAARLGIIAVQVRSHYHADIHGFSIFSSLPLESIPSVSAG